MTVVLMTGDVFVTYAGFATTTAGETTATGAVVVVVVVTARVEGGGGGGAETRCESGSETQPARRPRAPQHAMAGTSRHAARAVAEGNNLVRTFFFIIERIH